MLRSSLLALVLMGATLAPGASRAAGWHYYDPECPIALGSKAMKFVAMQPKKNIDRVCDALGDVGPTVIALDAPDSELREMIWDIRVIGDPKGDGLGSDAPEDIVYHLPVEKHRNGMVNFDFTFHKAGNYVLLAKLTSDDGKTEYVGRHPFTVGLADTAETSAYLLFGAFVLVVGGGFGYFFWKKKKDAQAA